MRRFAACLLASILIAGLAVMLWRWLRTGEEAGLRGLMEAGRLSEATEAAGRLTRQRPDAPQAWRWLATCHRLGGRLEQAAEALDRAFSLEQGGMGDLVADRALLRATGGDLEGTEKFLRAWWERNPREGWQADLAMAKGCLRRFRGKEALHHLDRWVKASPGSPFALAERGKAKAWLMAYQEAIEDLEASLTAGPPGERETRVTLARCLLENRQPARALERLGLLLEREDADAMEIRLGILCLLETGDLESAGRLLGKLARLPDAQGQNALMEARVEMARGEQTDWVQCEALLRRATALAPGDHEALFLWIGALRKSGREAEAKENENRLARLESAYARIQKIQRGEMDKAPRDPNLHAEVGGLLESVGNRDEALEWYQSALTIDPGHPGAVAGAARLRGAARSAAGVGAEPK